MIALTLALLAAFALTIMIVVEAIRMRAASARKPVARINYPRRQPELEDRIRAAFDGPRKKHGEIFSSYTIWRRDKETRMELCATDPFTHLNEFTRSLIVRHLWRALEALASGSVVVVDSPAQMWNEGIDHAFHDHGIDPWRLPSLGFGAPPQFVKE